MTELTLLQQAFEQESRANPYPIFAEMRKTPVAPQPDGTYVVSTYDEIVALLHDPRISSSGGPLGKSANAPFINRDPPEHDRLRRLATSHFGPPHRPNLVAELEPWLQETVDGLIDTLDGRSEIDVVDDFAYPFPVSAICRILGVPREDEPKFHTWSEDMIEALGARFSPGDHSAVFQRAIQAANELGEYLAGLADAHRKDPGDDIISGLVTDDGPDGRMADEDVVATGRLLLIAGHETTVNLMANGMLTLLRHPAQLERLHNEPGYAIPMIEELLRFEPPRQGAQRELHLEARQRRPEAVVDAAAEAEVLALGPVGVEAVRVGVAPLVAIAGSGHEHDVRFLGDRRVAELDVRQGDAVGDHLHGGLKAQQLFDQRDRIAGLVAQPLELLGMA